MLQIGPVGRACINSYLMVIGSLLAHGTAGGDFADLSQLVPQAALIAVLVFLGQRKFFEGPALAAVIALTQFSGHVFLGTASKSDLTMSASHVVAGLLTYVIISKFESLILLARDFLFSSFIGQVNAPKTQFSQPIVLVTACEVFVLKCEVLLIANPRRGPPNPLSCY